MADIESSITVIGISNEQLALMDAAKKDQENSNSNSLPTTANNNLNPPAGFENSGQPVGKPTIPGAARSIVAGTTTGVANDNLAHVCDFISEMQKNINLKKYTKALAKQIRDAIRYIMKALGLSDSTGEASWLANTLQALAREIKRIQKEILQPILDFEKYVLAYVTKLRAIIAWILSLPAKFLAMLQDCLAKLIKLIANIFTDIGAGLSEGFTEGPSDYAEIIKEAKNVAAAAQSTINSTIAVVGGATAIAAAVTIGLVVPASQSDLDAANQTIANYESPSVPSPQNRSAP
jgi:hypothetical protein